MRKDFKETPQYAVVAAVHLPGVSDEEFAASLTELRELAKTLGFRVTRTFVQNRAGFDSPAYLGGGKRQEAELSSQGGGLGMWARNIENDVGWQGMDCTIVILEIFHHNARLLFGMPAEPG